MRALMFMAPFILAGCADQQLTFGTVRQSTTVVDIYTQQVLTNLSDFIDDPWAIPSIVDIATGVVQIVQTATGTVTPPLSPTAAKNGSGLLTSLSSAGTGLSLGGNESYQQNWTVAAATDANKLRDFQLIYRYVLGYDRESDLLRQYKPPQVERDGKFSNDEFYLQYPHCIICTTAHIKNERLHTGWLFWTDIGPSRRADNPPPAETANVDLGHFGSHELYMRQSDYDRGFLTDLVLFMLPVAAPAQSAGQSGKPTAVKGRPSAVRAPSVTMGRSLGRNPVLETIPFAPSQILPLN